MNPPVFDTLYVPAVIAFVGDRIYQYGEAPQDVQRPYVVWQIVGGGPVNTLDCPPDMDNARVQISSFSDETVGTGVARRLMLAIRDAVEDVTNVVMGPFDSFEADTRMFRWTMDADFWDARD